MGVCLAKDANENPQKEAKKQGAADALPRKTIKNYRKDEPVSPKSPASCLRDSKAASNPVFNNVAPGVSPGASPPPKLDPDSVANVFMTTPCKLGTDFTDQELELVFANYAQHTAGHELEGTLSEMEVAVMVGHIFDAMADSLMETISVAMAGQEGNRDERDAELKRVAVNVERLVMDARESEAVGVVKTATREMCDPASQRIAPHIFQKRFNTHVKPTLNMIMTDIVQRRNDPVEA